MRRSEHGVADHRDVREGVPPIAEGAASLRRARSADPRSRRPGERLSPLRTGTAGSGPAGRLAPAPGDASGPYPARLHAGVSCGDPGDPCILGSGRGRHRRAAGPRFLPHRPALSDTGLVRESNQDTAYAGSRLLAVADGYGSSGAPASAAAVDALKRLETDSIPAGDLLNVLDDAIERAKQAVNGIAGAASSPEEAGTTLTAMLWTGSQLALVHIGDSRVYLLRDEELFQITNDHTIVQSMVDEGRLTPEEAISHPQRALLIRALGQGADATHDMRLHDAKPGDRYLLCSDGLSTVVQTEEVRRVLSGIREPEQAVRELIARANDSGGPDNVSCVVADVMELQQ